MSESTNNVNVTHANVVPAEPMPVATNETPDSILPKILRRWRTVLVTFVLMAVVTVSAVWLLVKPKHQAKAAIRVAPVVYSILFTDKEADNAMPMYDSFKNTQVHIMLSEEVLSNAAYELQDKKLQLFQPPPEDVTARLQQAWQTKDFSLLLRDKVGPLGILQDAVRAGDLRVTSGRKDELLVVSMDSRNPSEGVLIVDALVRAYMVAQAAKEEQGGDKKLSTLQAEQHRLAGEVEQQQESILRLTEEYGMADLARRHDMMIEYMETLQQQLTDMQANRSELEAEVRSLEAGGEEFFFAMDDGPERDTVSRRSAFINSDERLKKLTATLIAAEEALLLAEQTLASDNPELELKQGIIDALEEKLDRRRSELEEEFTEIVASEDGAMSEKMDGYRAKRLAQAKKALEHAGEYEDRLDERIKQTNTEAIALGRKHQLIKNREDQLELSKKLHDRVSERIKQLEMESKRPARVSIAYNASSAPLPSKQVKLMAGMLFASLAVGVGLAFLRAKADQSLRTPEDIIKLFNLPIIGTTMSLDGLERNTLSEYITHDYQTIRANLKLLNNGTIPGTMAIGSAGPREGKTTFAINLATSLAQGGHKVLLIDGDFRKPDLTRLLGFANGTKGFSEVAIGQCTLDDAVGTMSVDNLHVLRGCNGSMIDPVELLSRPCAGETLRMIAERYDHVIIDTPPILGAPESLLWAKLVDAVILTSYAGVTPGPALREAIDKLVQINVNILGNVLSSFRPYSGTSRYYYGSYMSGAYGKSKSSESDNAALFLPPGEKVRTAPNHSDGVEGAETGSGGIHEYDGGDKSRRRRNKTERS